LSYNTAVKKLTEQWKKVYKSNNPLKSLEEIDGQYPSMIREEMEQPSFLLPEPFYGPLESDMTNDLLVLLMNPGEVKEQDKYAPTINSSTIERYTKWNRTDFLDECGRLDKKWINIGKNSCNDGCILHNHSIDGCRWRRQRYREAKFDMGLDIDLLNTMEYIPYHTKKFNDLDKDIQKWMLEANTTKMAFDAVREIAENHLVKYIVSLGSAWINILEAHGYQPVEDKTVRSAENAVLGRLKKYQISENALPIVIHLVPKAVRFPTRPSVVNEMRRMLGESPLTVFNRNNVQSDDIVIDNLKEELCLSEF